MNLLTRWNPPGHVCKLVPQTCFKESERRSENAVLTITGERMFEKEEKGKEYHRIERAHGNFTRSFTLPEAVKADKVSAEFKDGVLHVRLPKDESAKPKSVEIKVP